MSSSSRIPASLQAVFLASNRGKEVYVPPPNRAANKSFLRNWIFQKRGSSSSGTTSGSGNGSSGKRTSARSLFGDSQEKIKCLAKHKNPTELNKKTVAVTTTISSTTAAANKTTSTTTSTTSSGRNVGEKTKRPSATTTILPVVVSSFAGSPQEFLDALLQERGYYSTDTYNTLLTAYYNRPTRHQIASYGTKMSQLAKQPFILGSDDTSSAMDEMKQMLQGGLSANPCNAYGESILHLVCRRGHVQMLQLLYRHGCNFSICDDYGRTPLHDTCWSPSPAFECVELLLQHAGDNGPRLFYMRDRRGSLPLSYVHKDHYPAWIEFLDNIKDVHWPIVKSDTTQGPPELAKYGPNSRPLPNPAHALPDHLCTMVANGRLTIDEALVMKKEQEQYEARAKAKAAQQLAAMLAAAEAENNKDKIKGAAAAYEQDAATANLSCDDSEDDDDDKGSDSDDDDDDDDDDGDDSGSDSDSCSSSSDYDDSSSYDEDQLEADGLFDVLQMTKAYMSKSRSS